MCAPLHHSEWALNQHRDSLALYVGFDSISQYISIAENETIGRVKFNSLQVRALLALCRSRSPLLTHECSTPLPSQKMIQPCGPPPPKEDE